MLWVLRSFYSDFTDFTGRQTTLSLGSFKSGCCNSQYFVTQGHAEKIPEAQCPRHYCTNIDLSAFSPDVSNFQLSLLALSVLDDQSSVKFLRQWPRHLEEGCRIVRDDDYFVYPEG